MMIRMMNGGDLYKYKYNYHVNVHIGILVLYIIQILFD